ncbi:hypothetical protein ACFQ2B_21765 [Streptomyces stramineus]
MVFGLVLAFNVRGTVTRKVERTRKRVELIHQATGRLGPPPSPYMGTAWYARTLGAVMIPFALLMTLGGTSC